MSRSPAAFWPSWEPSLQQFAETTGLVVSARDEDGELRLGPFAGSRLGQRLVRSSMWDAGASADEVERALVARALDGEPAAELCQESLRVHALPVRLLGRPRGAVVFGWVLADFATSVGSERLARVSGIPSKALWSTTRLEAPVSNRRMATYQALLTSIIEAGTTMRELVHSLEEHARAREVFLAHVSHELRTPLSSISLRLEDLLDGELDDHARVRAGLEAMQRSVVEEARLIEDLLEAAVTRTGQFTLAPSPIDLGDVVRAACDAIEPAARARRVEIACLGADAGLPIVADAHRLQQALWNVLSNAAKFSPSDSQIVVRTAVVAFIESPWDHDHLKGTPYLLSETAGALRMLDEERPGQLLEGIGRFLDNELVFDKRIPTTEQMDKLADALASLEYYLESARDRRGGLGHILDVAEQALRDLGLLAGTATPRAARTRAGDRDNLRQAGPQDGLRGRPGRVGQRRRGRGSHGPAGRRQRRGAGSGRGSGRPAPGRYRVDLAAAGRGLGRDRGRDRGGCRRPGAVGRRGRFPGHHRRDRRRDPRGLPRGSRRGGPEPEGQLAEWKKKPDDVDTLTPIRRAFHTLKGSGRLVGAGVLGEFSWKIENMLNRVLDSTIEASPAVVALVEHAVAALPQLLAALRDEGLPTAPLSRIMDLADQLSDGGSPDIEAELKPSGERVTRVVKRRVPRVDADAGEIPSATLAGVSSEEQAEQPPAAEAIPIPMMVPMDPVLMEILRSEIAQHLATMRSKLDAAGSGELKVDEALLHAVHTMHGAIAMVEVPLLSEVLLPLEGYLKRLRASDVSVSDEGREALAEAMQVTEQVASQFDASEPMLPATDALVERLCDLRDALDEPKLAHPIYTHDLLDEDEDEVQDGEAATGEPDAITEIDLDSLATRSRDRGGRRPSPPRSLPRSLPPSLPRETCPRTCPRACPGRAAAAPEPAARAGTDPRPRRRRPRPSARPRRWRPRCRRTSPSPRIRSRRARWTSPTSTSISWRYSSRKATTSSITPTA